jgi:hypothetical protein
MLDNHEPRQELAREECQLRIALIAGAVLFALEAAIYIPDVFRGSAVRNCPDGLMVGVVGDGVTRRRGE